MSPPRGRDSRTSVAGLPVALLVVLSILGVAYTARGYNALLRGTERSDAIDLRQKWIEHRYFLSGVNPYDAWLQYGPLRSTPAAAATVTARGTAPNLGVIDPASPPWAYVQGLLWFWPPWPWARMYLAALDLLASILIGLWAAGELRTLGERWAQIGLSLPFAMGAAVTAVAVGQYTLIVLALLTGSLWAAERGRHALAGFCLVAALAKPTIAAPFVLVFLAQRYWRTLLWALPFGLLSSSITYLVVRTSPLEMLSQLSLVGNYLAGAGSVSLTRVLIAAGVPAAKSTPLVAGTMVVLLIAGLWHLRGQPVLTLAGLAAIAGRLWAYHRPYDDPMLVFPLIALIILTVRLQRRDVGIVTVSFGATLLAPGRFLQAELMELVLVGIWIAGAVCLVAFKQPVALPRARHTRAV